MMQFIKSILIVFSFLIAVHSSFAQDVLKSKTVPQLQLIPLPYDEVSFQQDGVELTRYHFGSLLNRPFLYPINGPTGWSLTRMGHPHDAQSHSHHNSVWISHFDVGGVDFWGDTSGAKIRHKRIVEYEDKGTCSWLVMENEWVDKGGKVLLDERRQVAVQLLDNKEWMLVIDVELKAKDKPVTLGKTPFGLIGVRMTKTIGVHDGGGTIRNSEGAVNEKEVFWKQARWVDYSGAIRDVNNIEGVTLLDHPKNPNHPSYFHVRNDGWMGASLCFDGSREIATEKPLHVRYGLYIHSKMADKEAIEAKWKLFSELDLTKAGSDK